MDDFSERASLPHWSILEQRSFDAWGSLTHLKTKNGLFTTEQAILNEILQNGLILDRGYTGHEHLWMVGIVNMNGRLYDPALKRFLSPDNFIQDPYNTQNFNRYGYVLNNPLIYTDPSGEEIFTFLFLALATIIEAALPPALIGAAIAIGTTMLSNAIAGNPLHWGIGKAAAFGALSGVVSAGIGSIASTMGPSKFLFQAGAHGISGGIFAELSGGDFGSGFAAGFVSSLIGGAVQGMGIKAGSHGTQLNKFGNSPFFKASIIASGGLSGGISASLSGGKFWDGARQGLITSGLNHVMHSAMRNSNPPDPCPKGQKCDAKGNVIKEDKNKKELVPEKLHKMFDSIEEVGGWMEIGGLVFAPSTGGTSMGLVALGAGHSFVGVLGNGVVDLYEYSTTGDSKHLYILRDRTGKAILTLGMGKAIEKIPGGEYMIDKILLKTQLFIYEKLIFR